MGRISIPVEITGTRGQTGVMALLDTGADSNYLRRRLDSGRDVDDVGFSEFGGKRATFLADGSTLYGDRVVFPEIRLLRRKLEAAPFIVVGDLQVEAILGVRLMQELKLTLSPPTHEAWPAKTRR